MYVKELQAFIRAATGGKCFPNTLADDIAVLKALVAAERNARHA